MIIHYKEGFSGPITLTAEGLPPGVHARPTTIRDSRGTFVLWADTDARDWAGPVKLVATAKVGDATLRHEVRPYTRVWAQANLSSSRPMRELMLAVRESAPFAVRFASERLEVKAKSKVELKLHVDRLWPDCKNAVTVLPLSLSGPFRMSNVQVTADKSEVTVPIEVQPGAKPGEYTVAVIGQAQVPYSKDPAAKQKSNTLVTQPSRPLTLVVLP